MSGYSGVSDREKVKLIKVGLNVISKWRNMEEYGEGSEQQKKGDKKMFEVNFEKITDCICLLLMMLYLMKNLMRWV